MSYTEHDVNFFLSGRFKEVKLQKDLYTSCFLQMPMMLDPKIPSPVAIFPDFDEFKFKLQCTSNLSPTSSAMHQERQPRSQGLLRFQNGGRGGEDPTLAPAQVLRRPFVKTPDNYCGALFGRISRVSKSVKIQICSMN